MSKTTIKDLQFDDRNANKHTQKGMRLLEKSLGELGMGRSILIDKDDRIIAGNGVVETAGSIGLENVRIIETDGTEIIAVKRTDVSLDSSLGRRLAIADNQTAKEGIDLDLDIVADLSADFDVDLQTEWQLEGFNYNNMIMSDDELMSKSDDRGGFASNGMKFVFGNCTRFIKDTDENYDKALEFEEYLLNCNTSELTETICQIINRYTSSER